MRETNTDCNFATLNGEEMQQFSAREFGTVCKIQNKTPVNERHSRLYRLLSSSLSDNPKILSVWFQILRQSDSAENVKRSLAKGNKNPAINDTRESLVLSLFQRISPQFYKEVPEGNLLYRAYSQDVQRVARWLLSRYDLAGARRVIAGNIQHGRSYRLIDWSCLLLVLAMIAIATVFVHTGNRACLIAIPFSYFLLGIGPLAFMSREVSRRVQIDISLRLLLPRLAAAVAVGWLFLVSETPITGALLKSKPAPWVALALVSVAGYLWLEMGERCKPLLQDREAIARLLRIIFLGVAHSLSIVLVSAQYFENTHNVNVGALELFLMSGTLLTVGIIINVVWAEEAVTAPL